MGWLWYSSKHSFSVFTQNDIAFMTVRCDDKKIKYSINPILSEECFNLIENGSVMSKIFYFY